MATVPTAEDLQGYSDEEFAALQAAVAVEQQRRWVLAQAIDAGTALTQQYVAAVGGTAEEQAAAVKAAWTQILANCGIDPAAASAAAASAAE